MTFNVTDGVRLLHIIPFKRAEVCALMESCVAYVYMHEQNIRVSHIQLTTAPHFVPSKNMLCTRNESRGSHRYNIIFLLFFET